MAVETRKVQNEPRTTLDTDERCLDFSRSEHSKTWKERPLSDE